MAGECAGSKTEGDPGQSLKCPAPIAVPALGVVPVPVSGAAVTRITVQNSTIAPAGGIIRVHELGGAPGGGALLKPLQAVSFGGADGSVVPLEVEGDPVNPTTFNVIYEKRQ